MEQPKRQISALNVMAIRVQLHANVSKQATLLDGLDISPLKCRVCGCGYNRFVHEGINHISNVEVHLKTRSGNVNILHMGAGLRKDSLRHFSNYYILTHTSNAKCFINVTLINIRGLAEIIVPVRGYGRHSPKQVMIKRE